jgi:hypothetical protein
MPLPQNMLTDLILSSPIQFTPSEPISIHLNKTQKLALTSPIGGRSVGIIRSRTQATEFVLLFSSTLRCPKRSLAVRISKHDSVPFQISPKPVPSITNMRFRIFKASAYSCDNFLQDLAGSGKISCTNLFFSDLVTAILRMKAVCSSEIQAVT